MKRNVLIIVLAAVLVVLIIAASGVYDKLSAEYLPESSFEDEKQELADAAQLAPDFTVLDYNEEQINLSDYYGKPIVLNFWATWCGPCKSEMPAFDSAYAEYGDEIVFLMINMTDGSRDTVEGAKSFIQEQGYSFPICFDTELSAALTYGAYSIPLTVFINADGTIMTGHSGAMSEGTLNSYINQLIS